MLNLPSKYAAALTEPAIVAAVAAPHVNFQPQEFGNFKPFKDKAHLDAEVTHQALFFS